MYIINNEEKYQRPPMPIADAVQHAVNVLPVPSPEGPSILETAMGKGLINDLLLGGESMRGAAKRGMDLTRVAGNALQRYQSPGTPSIPLPSDRDIVDSLKWWTKLPVSPVYVPYAVGKVLKSIF